MEQDARTMSAVQSVRHSHALRCMAPFLDPRWMGTMRSGKHQAVPVDRCTLRVYGEYLQLVEPDEYEFIEGRTYLVYNVYGNFACENEEDAKQREVDAKLRYEQQRAREIEERLNRDANNAAFNARIHLPNGVEWVPGQKAVLSGLSANSWGDGQFASSVTHVYLIEALQDGRLHRNAGDFLCSSNNEANGKRWIDPIRDREEAWKGKVSCISCLDTLKRKGWLADE